MKNLVNIYIIKSLILKIGRSRRQNRKKYAVTEILGTILVLMIISGAVSTILFWGIPYMVDKKASVGLESALLQFDAMCNLIDDAFYEGVFDVDNGELADSSKTMTFQFSGDNIKIDTKGERFVFWYSLDDKYDFNVSDLDPDGDEYSFSINFSELIPTHVNVYYLYDDNLAPENLIINNLIVTQNPLHDAIQIDVLNTSLIVGRIWLFDVGSLIYESVSPSGTYKAIVENGGVLSTGLKTSWNFFNEPKYWPQTLLDDSTMLTLRMLQIKKTPSEGVDSIGGTDSRKIKFLIRPNSSLIIESKIQIFSDFRINIYGDKNTVSAWRFFYIHRMGFQGNDNDESLSWTPPPEANKVMFSLNYAVCYIDMEV